MNKKFLVEKRWLGITAGILNHIFAWIGPLVFVLVLYRKPFFQSGYSVYLTPTFIAAALALRFVWYRLTVAIEEGVAFDRQLAREVKFLLPLIIISAIVAAVMFQIAFIDKVIIATLISNIVAVPFRLIAYRYSKRYYRDMAGLKANQTLEEIAKSIK